VKRVVHQDLVPLYTHADKQHWHGGHLLRRDFFVWTSRLVHWLRKKKLCLPVGQIFVCDELRVGLAGLRREKQHRRGVVNRWILTSVWDGAAVALAVTEGMNHQKCVFFPLAFYLRTTYIVRETCVALNHDL
jgi:hypothetical protein